MQARGALADQWGTYLGTSVNNTSHARQARTEKLRTVSGVLPLAAVSYPMVKADRSKKLHPSKVRAIFFCDDCGRPRCLYSETMPTKSELRLLDAYLETVTACCGDALFPEHVRLDGPEEKLKAKFYNKENLSCRDDVELAYFNYGGLRGRAEFEHVCARCGADPTESPLVAKEALASYVPGGKTALPLCEGCFASDKGPVLVGRVRNCARG